MNDTDTLLTITEASQDYFQGKVSGRLLTRLFNEGVLPGFRVGRSKRGKIVLYKSGLDAWRQSTSNQQQEGSDQ